MIEEIQSDWITGLLGTRRVYERMKGELSRNNRPLTEFNAHRIQVLKKYMEALHFEVKYWPEITLYAALEVLRDQLGLKRIWYHTPGSGNLLKHMGYGGAPKSHYKDLPRRFGFRKTQEWPAFILKGRWARRKNARAKCEAESTG